MFFINRDIDSDERYDLQKFMDFDTDVFDVLSSSFLNKVISLPLGGLYFLQGEENRPDLLSFNLYGDVQYWWILLMYNNLTSNEGLVSGMTIRYPSITELENLFFALRSEEI